MCHCGFLEQHNVPQRNTPLPLGKQVCHPVVGVTYVYIYIYTWNERRREKRVGTAMQRTKKVLEEPWRECNGLYLDSFTRHSPLATTMPSSSESYSQREPLVYLGAKRLVRNGTRYIIISRRGPAVFCITTPLYPMVLGSLRHSRTFFSVVKIESIGETSTFR